MSDVEPMVHQLLETYVSTVQGTAAECARHPVLEEHVGILGVIVGVVTRDGTHAATMVCKEEWDDRDEAEFALAIASQYVEKAGGSLEIGGRSSNVRPMPRRNSRRGRPKR